jgi:hypothetical protein
MPTVLLERTRLVTVAPAPIVPEATVAYVIDVLEAIEAISVSVTLKAEFDDTRVIFSPATNILFVPSLIAEANTTVTVVPLLEILVTAGNSILSIYSKPGRLIRAPAVVYKMLSAVTKSVDGIAPGSAESLIPPDHGINVNSCDLRAILFYYL